MFVKLDRAIEVVMDLARENVLTEGDVNDGEDLEEAREEQLASIDTVDDFFANYLDGISNLVLWANRHGCNPLLEKVESVRTLSESQEE